MGFKWQLVVLPCLQSSYQPARCSCLSAPAPAVAHSVSPAANASLQGRIPVRHVMRDDVIPIPLRSSRHCSLELQLQDDMTPAYSKQPSSAHQSDVAVLSRKTLHEQGCHKPRARCGKPAIADARPLQYIHRAPPFDVTFGWPTTPDTSRPFWITPG